MEQETGLGQVMVSPGNQMMATFPDFTTNTTTPSKSVGSAQQMGGLNQNQAYGFGGRLEES